jgi:predicted RNase H-like HicB family nuclease
MKKTQKRVLDFNAVFLEEAEGGYSVIIPSLPGCFSQGNTFEKAAENVKEAIALYLEDESVDDVVEYKAKREFMAPVRVYAV